jgi:murein DD-endopeptidase MepM/ murein hydrolase activator NlpD
MDFFLNPLRRAAAGTRGVRPLSLLLALVAGLHLFLFAWLLGDRPAALPDSPVETAVAAPPDRAKEEVQRVVEGTLRRGSGLGSSLREKGVPENEISSVLSHLEPVLDFRRLRPGQQYLLEYGADESLARFTYRTGPLDQVVLVRGGDSWQVDRETIPYSTKVETLTGTIETSLFEGVERAGEGSRLAVQFVDIFAWDIDFSHELQRGDTFRIVFEKIFRDGEFLQYGRILGAQYRDRDELHEAYYFPWPDGGDYYDPSGKSVRKTFLRAPVSYSRISSGYTYRRLHPVLKKVQPHLGIDYAAPTGTPVWAPADGTVVSLSRDKTNGRKVVLRHPGGYQSYFLHLSRFARGLRKGSKVRQKDVIGFVGSTGLSTGPHLDYRMKRHGRWINPLREKFPPGKPLPKEYAGSFREYRDWLAGRLSTPVEPFISSAGPAGGPAGL